jgi:transposase
MTLFVGLDVSVKETAVCVVDDTGKVVCEQKVPTEPDDIVRLLASIGEDYGRIGIEAGPLSQWLVNGLTAAGLPVVCVETRHMMALLKAQQINKSDRNDARGIAQMMRVGRASRQGCESDRRACCRSGPRAFCDGGDEPKEGAQAGERRAQLPDRVAPGDPQ